MWDIKSGLIFGGKRIPMYLSFLLKKNFIGYFDFNVGKPIGMDGHAAIYGGSGSGKSSCSAIPSIRAWDGPIFAVDVKGELVTQPTKFPKKILNLNGGTADSSRYDPFYLLRRGGSEHLIQNSRELANAIVPLKVNERDEFWPLAARSVLTASIAYHFQAWPKFY